MESRLDYGKVLPEGMKFIYNLDKYSANCGLESGLLDLIKLRASQINGCPYCIDMHTKDARTGGESEQRLYSLSVWRDTPYYSERERAALALTEAVTLISNNNVPDEIYLEVRKHFNEEEIVKLIIGISIINVWNRFAITFRDEPGSYIPDHFVSKSNKELKEYKN